VELVSVTEAIASIGLGESVGSATMFTEPETLRGHIPDKYTSLNSSR